MRRIWATRAARIFRVSRIFRANGTLAHSWGLRDDGRARASRWRQHRRPCGTPIPQTGPHQRHGVTRSGLNAVDPADYDPCHRVGADCE